MRTISSQRNSRGSRPATVIAAVTLTLASAATAHGQYALGGGNALDANPNRVTGRTNLPAQTPDFRSRNLTVTGEVAGGREFRGEVGYTADGSFRGQLASDDLFRFRAGSLFSSPAAISSMPDQFRFGQQLGVVEYRRGGVPTPASQAPGFEGQWQAPDIMEASIVDRIRMDQLTRGATSTERSMLEGRSRTVGVVVDEQGQPYFVEASSLRGLGYTPAAERYRTQGISALDRIRLREDLAAGRVSQFGTPAEWQFEQLAQQERLAEHRATQDDRRLPELPQTQTRDDRQPTDGVDTRFDPTRPGAQGDPRERDRLGLATPDQQRSPMTEQDARHRAIIDRIAQRYANAENVQLHIDPRVLRELDEEFERIRGQLTRRDQSLVAPAEETEEPEEQQQDQPQRPATELPGLHVDPERAIPLLRHGQRVEQLTGVEHTRFNELMELAEQNLRDGEFFMAERQFLRALQFHPGEPMATAGMAHAQLGAGLYTAASLTLQRLFATNPEMIDVRFDPALLPSRPRLVQVIENIENRLNQRRDRDAVSFLLAYIGHQMQDIGLVRRGLSIMAEVRPEDDLLLRLLQGVWGDVQTPADK